MRPRLRQAVLLFGECKQLRAQHLAIVRARQARDEAYRARLLEGGEPRPAMLHHVVFADRHPGLDHHEGGHGFTPFGVRQADDGDFRDRRMQQDHVLDLLRHDGAGARADHFFQPAHDGEEAVRIELADVAGMQPAVVQRGAGCGLILPVARHDIAAADQHFA